MGTQLPYPIQPQGMPLPYTLPRAGPYPASYMSAPPMPTAYNPYATMHYPPQGTLLLLFFFYFRYCEPYSSLKYLYHIITFTSQL